LRPYQRIGFWHFEGRTIFKFVIKEESDVGEAKKEYIEPFHIPNKYVFLMPEGVNAEKLKERSKWLVELCMKEGFRFTGG